MSESNTAGWITQCAQCGCLAFTSWPSEVPEDRSVLCHCPGVAWAEPVRWLEAAEAWPSDLVRALRCEWSQASMSR